jgi:hypothetical protein
VQYATCSYEVDPLKCPKCGGTMKIVSFIDQEDVIEAILRHCGKLKVTPSRAPPNKKKRLGTGLAKT